MRGGEEMDLPLAGGGDLPRAVDLRHAAERLGAGLEDEIVDGEFDAVLFEAGVELLAEGEERGGVDFDFDVEVRELRLRLNQASGDRAAHVGDGDRALFLNRALGKMRGAGGSG